MPITCEIELYCAAAKGRYAQAFDRYVEELLVQIEKE
jgi:hypothetical protein